MLHNAFLFFHFIFLNLLNSNEAMNKENQISGHAK